jgi:hypothetical protein
VRIVRDKEEFSEQVFWSKYFKKHFHNNLEKSIPPTFPKFIHYAAHAETLATMFEGLGLHRKTRVSAGSSLFIEFISDRSEYFIRIYELDG